MAGYESVAEPLNDESLAVARDASVWKRRHALLLVFTTLCAAALLLLTHGFSEVDSIPDMQRLIALSREVDPDLLNVANQPFETFANRSLQGGRLPEAYDVEANLGIAVCVVDAGQALFQLAQGLMAFNAASTACPDDESEDAKKACAAAITYGLAGVMWSVSFTSLAVSDCAGSLNLQGACSADLTSLMGSFTYLASSISLMTLNCPSGGATDPKAIVAENSGIPGRRLGNLPPVVEKIQTLEANKAAQAAAKATCVFDVGHAAFWLARVGTSITQATLHCTPENVAKGEAGKVACAVDVSGIVGAATFAATAIIYAVVGCPALVNKDNSDLICAAAIIDTVGLAAYFAQGFSSISSTCGALHT
ncbi:unnamed protein product [Durusdinium trenchii]|uniref:CASP-like protein n=2 Tax=Durusdinium trenchii TaxID=1381693 RepID=A0ABP0IKM1_9DINO